MLLDVLCTHCDKPVVRSKQPKAYRHRGTTGSFQIGMDDSKRLQTRTRPLQGEPAKTSPCSQSDDDAVVDCEVIDGEGDVLLRSGVKEFQVSFKVFTLASSYFDIMFRSELSKNMRCGIRLFHCLLIYSTMI